MDKITPTGITPPGINTTAASQAQKAMGDRPTATTNTPNIRPGETQLTLQWFGKKGKPPFLLPKRQYLLSQMSELSKLPSQQSQNQQM